MECVEQPCSIGLESRRWHWPTKERLVANVQSEVWATCASASLRGPSRSRGCRQLRVAMNSSDLANQALTVRRFASCHCELRFQVIRLRGATSAEL